MFEQLEQLCIKITSKGESGSAVIYLPDNDLEIVYVCTALHCIYGKKFDNEAVNSDIKLQIPEKEKEYQVRNEDAILKFEDQNKDIAIIVVNKSALETALDIQIPQLDLYYHSLSLADDVIFRGYPNATSAEEAESTRVKFIHQSKTSNRIELESITDLTSATTDAEDNVPGFSGSGVFIFFDEKLHLVGIVDSFFDKFKRFFCFDVLLIIELIKNHPGSQHIPLLNAKELKDFVEKTTKIENRLKEKNQELFNQLSDIKRSAIRLIKSHGNNFEKCSRHTSKHCYDLPQLIANSILSADNINSLNENELFVLSASTYLHDIGICQTKEEFLEKYQSDFEESSHSARDIYDYIYEIHEKVSSDFITLNGTTSLGIPENYLEAIRLVSTNMDDYKNLDIECSVDESRNTINLSYLGGLIHLANRLDIKNYATRTLFSVIKDNRIDCEESKMNWKNPNNLKIEFKKTDFISFTGNCEYQATYIAVNSHIKLLELELKEFHKTMRLNLQEGEREIDYKYITAKDFIADKNWKNIGFTYEYTTLFNSLIGDRLYQGNLLLDGNREIKKISALREAIQNSRDACLIKKKYFSEYEPLIIVELLENGNIKVTDNGIGMDEFIVENYFARLGASSHIMQGHNDVAVGQFGIGVFSYFTIADYFTIKTHKKDQEPLVFDVPKNPNSYFYFHEVNNEIPIGTELTLHIREEFKNVITYELLEESLTYYTRFLDLKIVLKRERDDGNVISQKALEINDLDEIYRRNSIFETIDETLQIEIIKGSIDEGELGAIFIKNNGVYEFPRFVQNQNNSAFFYIELLNQKILIKEVHGRIFTKVFGRISADFSTDINLSREEFANHSKVNELQDKAESLIIEQLLDNWTNNLRGLEMIDRQRILLGFINSPVYFGRSLKEKIQSDFLLEIHTTSLFDIESTIIHVNELPTQFPRILFVLNGRVNRQSLYRSESIPLLILWREWNEQRFFQYFLTHEDIGMGGQLFIHICQYGAFIGISYEGDEELIDERIEHLQVLKFNDNSLWTWLNHYGRSGILPILNASHPIVEYYLANRVAIKANRELNAAFKMFFDHLRRIDNHNMRIYGPILNDKIEEINAVIGEALLNHITNIELPFELRNQNIIR